MLKLKQETFFLQVYLVFVPSPDSVVFAPVTEQDLDDLLQQVAPVGSGAAEGSVCRSNSFSRHSTGRAGHGQAERLHTTRPMSAQHALGQCGPCC